MKPLHVCGLHGAYRGSDCPRCDEAWRPDEPLDGEPIPAPPERERTCEVCLHPSLTNWCHACERVDGDSFTRLFGSSL